MKTILVPFHNAEVGLRGLNAAAMLARRFGSYVEGLLVGTGPHIEVGHGIPVPAGYLSDVARTWREFADDSLSRFRGETQAKGLAMGELETEAEGPIAGWREIEGDEAHTVGERGRLFDLIVLGRPDEPTSRWHATCEAALFETGRPVLLVAGDRMPTIGRMVVIAWNGSTESARAIALAMPLLTGASEVVVVTVEGGMIVDGPAGRDVAAHLHRNGIKARATTIDPAQQSTGEAFLGEATRLGADLLIKGAYTRSRLRQYIFGGFTEHVLRHAPVPVLMAH